MDLPPPEVYFVGFFSILGFMNKPSIDKETVSDKFLKIGEAKLEIYAAVFPSRHLVNSKVAQSQWLKI